MRTREEIEAKLRESEAWLEENEGMGHAEEGVETGWADALSWVLN